MRCVSDAIKKNEELFQDIVLYKVSDAFDMYTCTELREISIFEIHVF